MGEQHTSKFDVFSGLVVETRPVDDAANSLHRKRKASDLRTMIRDVDDLSSYQSTVSLALVNYFMASLCTTLAQCAMNHNVCNSVYKVQFSELTLVLTPLELRNV